MFLKKLDQHIEESLQKKGFESPIGHQKSTISAMKSGADVLLISPEKSGKTTAIVIGLVQKLKAALNDVPRALILVADRDKAENMKLMFEEIGEQTNLRVFCVYPKPALQKLKDAIYYGSDVVIGTVKRLNELYSNNGLNLNDLQYLIVDDTHETMKAEMIAQVDRLARVVPHAQIMVSTSSSNERIKRFAEAYMPRLTIIK